MLPGIALGLFAALTFGLSDFLSALVSRQVGTLYTLLGVHVIGVVLFLFYFLRAGGAIHLQVGSLPIVLLTGAGLGLLDVLAYFSFYTGLSIGPVAVVSPITASYSLVTVLLAVIVLGESTTFWQGIGICSVLGGVILVSIDVPAILKKWRSLTSVAHWKSFFLNKWQMRAQLKSGSFFGCVAMIGFGLHLFFLSRWTQVVGPLVSVFFIRLFSAIALGVFALFYRREALPRRIPLKSLGGISLIGVFDTLGLLAYSVGTMKESTSVVTTLASSYSLLPIFLGIIVFRERLARVQGAGIVAILLGLGLLAALHR